MKEKKEKKQKKNHKKGRIRIPVFRSLSTKIALFVIIAVLVAQAALIISFKSAMEKDIRNTVENYMVDEADLSGKLLDEATEYLGYDKATSADYLKEVLKDIKISNYKSSYAYLVAADGTMLYHPTASKIGQPVANDVIKKVAQNLNSGTYAFNTVFTEYDYNGIHKFSSYKIVCDNKCILVITADKDDVLDELNSASSSCIMISFGTLVLICIAAVVLGRIIAKPIVKVTEQVNGLSKLELKLDESISKMAGKKTETGLMSKAVIELGDNLRKIIYEIQNQSNTLYATSEELANSSINTVNSIRQVEIAVGEVADGANSQAEETTNATSNVIDMGNMIEVTNDEIGKLKTSSDAIMEAVKEATDILHKLLKINEEASESIDMIYDRTNTTNRSVEDIKAAITIITSIAEETNLLSLNASIEAARAGEQGRGFAVVASQIQKLAEQSNESAKHIEEIIEKLIIDSNQAVSGMQDVKAIMEQQSRNVGETNKAFDRVKVNIDASMRGISEIVDTTTKLDNARIAVTDTVQNLSAIAEENAASSQECSASVTEVCTIMDKVTEGTERLKEISKVIDEQLHEFII